jgi:hypothetical protein
MIPLLGGAFKHSKQLARGLGKTRAETVQRESMLGLQDDHWATGCAWMFHEEEFTLTGQEHATCMFPAPKSKLEPGFRPTQACRRPWEAYHYWRVDGGREVYLHRVICALRHGPPCGEDTLVIHLCERLGCCAPWHMKWGKFKENRQRASKKRRLTMVGRLIA